MKQNLEISLKFWIAMAAFFCIVLSVPLSDYLFDKNITNYRELFGICLIVIVMLICTIAITSLRYSELKYKHKNNKFFSDMSFQTLEDYEIQIKEQSDEIDLKNTKIEQLKTAFEDAVAEITDLRSMYNERQERIKILGEQITYWKERALHRKHAKKEIDKEVDSEWWECMTDIYGKYFTKGKLYIQHPNKIESLKETHLLLITNEGVEGLAHKTDFNPAK